VVTFARSNKHIGFVLPDKAFQPVKLAQRWGQFLTLYRHLGQRGGRQHIASITNKPHCIPPRQIENPITHFLFDQQWRDGSPLSIGFVWY